MSAPLASESDLGLIFAWEHPRRRRAGDHRVLWADPLVLHALCFYVFQIIYPPAVALLPPPGRVTVIAPNTEEGRVLLRWLEAEDPALASTTQPPAGGKSLAMPTIQHAPSYLTRQPALREIPPAPARSGHSKRPAACSRCAAARPNPSRRRKSRPRLCAGHRNSKRVGALQRPEMKFTASGHESPQAAQFRVAVDENGAVRYCFVERSSGDAALDEQARKYLALSRFSPIENRKSKIENDLTWGTATVEWGNDIVAPTPATESVAP